MSLKYTFSELFKGKLPVARKLFETLEDLSNQIDNGSDATPVIKKDVNLTKKDLTKAFGKPKDFVNIGVVHNAEGSYLIVAHDKNFKHIALENI